MNKILTTSISDPTIGQPLTGKSLEFLQNATKEGISSIIESSIGFNYSTSTYYVIKGLEPYGTNQFYAGYVYYNGEVYYSVGKATTTAFSNIPVLTLTVTNDATADPLTFTDNVSRDVHNVRRMVMSDAVSGSGTVDLANCVYLKTHWIYVGASGYLPPFTAIPAFQNSWVNEGSGTYFNLAFRKNSIESVSIRGRIQSGASTTTIFTLPTGYRPAKNCIFPIVSRAAADYASLEILTTGAVALTYGGAATDWFLDGITIPLTDY